MRLQIATSKHSIKFEFTILNALFGAMEITENANTSKYKYKGYGTCFDKGGSFSEGSINNGRNVLIFGVHESSLLHSNDKANNIYVMGKGFVQGIKTRHCMQKKYTVKILLNQTKILY